MYFFKSKYVDLVVDFRNKVINRKSHWHKKGWQGELIINVNIEFYKKIIITETLTSCSPVPEIPSNE